ncbi:terpenoid cyclases/protein prenyltransferase alpha-alpha toroid [Infundibulicybe gibba]|nr:terpenoid cyclases/protein prenyltransferase alpha-alpha toroid [Infundibulicybe gibba]
MSGHPSPLPPLARVGHAAHCKRCLSGAVMCFHIACLVLEPFARLAVAFYCIGSLDLLGTLQDGTTEAERELWRQWIWEQQTSGQNGSGFKPSSFMTGQHSPGGQPNSNYNNPHIIMTYTALISLSMLRDDFARLERPGIPALLRACQREDGSFTTVPGSAESDLRTLYCAFAISNMLNDWSGVDINRAVSFIKSCRTYEGGYGQSPHCEAQGGTTYTAIASLHLLPPNYGYTMPPDERDLTIHWLLSNQDASGGSVDEQILGANSLVDARSLVHFLARCQFKYGGIAKAPGNHPDPYHTYLSLAALSIYIPSMGNADLNTASWTFETLDPLLNARMGTSDWAKVHIPARG